jgi:hypothetical protein
MGIWQSKKHWYALNAWGTSIVTYRLANAHQVTCFFHCLHIVDLETLWFVNFLLLYVSKEPNIFHGAFGLLFSWFSVVWWSKFSKFLLPRNWIRFQIFFKNICIYHLAWNIMLQEAKLFMTRVWFPHNVIRWSFLVSHNVPCSM